MAEHLFLDLDHTLWDFEANAAETLRELYERYGLADRSQHAAEDFIAFYNRVNDRMWVEYRAGRIDKPTLRTERFKETFRLMGIPEAETPDDLWENYLQICPTKTRLIEGARPTLDYLAGRYALHIITNGFAETQRKKLKHSQLEHYFDSVTISEEVGWKKPAPEIFIHALKTAGSTARSSRYIGDSFEADVQGALAAGWQVYWFEPRSDHDFSHPDLTKIYKLAELKAYL